MKRKMTMVISAVCIMTLVGSMLPGLQSHALGELEGHTHTYDLSAWDYNEDGHWHPYTCGCSGFPAEMEGHDGPHSCTICGFSESQSPEPAPISPEGPKEDEKDSAREGFMKLDDRGSSISIFSKDYQIKDREETVVINQQIEAQVKNSNPQKLVNAIADSAAASSSAVENLIPDNTVDLTNYTNSFSNLEKAVDIVVEMSNKKSESGNGTEATSIYTKDPMPMNNNIIESLSKSEGEVVLVFQTNDNLVSVTMDPSLLRTVRLEKNEVVGPLKVVDGIITETIISKEGNVTGSEVIIDGGTLDRNSVLEMEPMNVKRYEDPSAERLAVHLLNLKAILNEGSTFTLEG